MAEQWYYRMFGQDFGPVSFEELKQLAELGSISASDEVRSASSSAWEAAGSIADLALEKDHDLAGPRSVAVAEAPAPSGPVGADDWYYMFHGQELGPIGFDEVLAFAEQGQLEANDEVRLGVKGKWRRVGSIGRLVAVLPYHEPAVTEPKQPEKLDSATVVSSAPKMEAASIPLNTLTSAQPTAASVSENALLEAQIAYKAIDTAAKSLIAWAVAPNVDPAWWGWIAGAEYGPVGFVQVFEWAQAGRLQRTDFLKNGIYGQYVPATNIPGLFNAIDMLRPAKMALEAAQAAATANASKGSPAQTLESPKPTQPAPKPTEAAKPVEPVKLASPPAAIKSEPAPAPAITKSGAAIPSVDKGNSSAAAAEEKRPTEPRVLPDETRSADSRPMETRPAMAPRPVASVASNMGSSSFAANMASSPRPTPVPLKPAPRPKREWSGPSLGDLTKDPKAIGAVATIAVVLLIYGATGR